MGGTSPALLAQYEPALSDSARLSPDQVLAKVQSLYRQLQRLPYADRPSNGCVGRQSAAYLALEAEIRGWAERYQAMTAE